MVIRTLTAADFDAVFEAFNDAFSDYVVPFHLQREQLAELLRRRGWAPEASVAAFDDGRMVAFTLNGLEDDRGYDSGTGVVPTHRRQGLARELMQRSADILRDRGCSSYVLEVIETNVNAVELYRSLGFRETRGLQCWRYEAHRHPDSHADSQAHSGAAVSLEAFEPVSLLWDVLPSWQNSPTSLRRATDELLTLGDADGYVIVCPATGDVPQLAVRRESRRRGIGTRVLHAAGSIAKVPLRILNVDDRDDGIARFLEAAGAARTVRQLEMILAL